MMSRLISALVHFNNASVLQCKHLFMACHIVHKSVPIFVIKSALLHNLFPSVILKVQAGFTCIRMPLSIYISANFCIVSQALRI